MDALHCKVICVNLLSLPGISTTSAESQVRDVLLHTCLRANGGFSKIFAEGGASFGHPSRHILTDGGYFIVPSETVFIHVGLRPISIGNGTLTDAVAYSQSLKAYPLADAAKPTTRCIDGYPKAWKTLTTFDVSYFQLLADAIAVEPPQPKDAAMLADTGIERASRSGRMPPRQAPDRRRARGRSHDE